MTPVPFKDRLRALAAGFAREALRVPLRFPVPLLCALAWTVFMSTNWGKYLYGSALESTVQEQMRLYLPVALFASLAGHLLAESRGWKPWAGILAASAGAGVVAVFTWGALGGYENVVTARWWLAMPAASLCAVCAPFLRRGVNDDAAWRFITASLRGAGLALGIAAVTTIGLVALVHAIEVLFGVEGIPQRVYTTIWTTCFGTGAAWIALAAIPRMFGSPANGPPPPWERRVVAGLLVPLGLIYLLLVYLSALLALVRWQLPEGTIGATIACLAAFGVAVWLAAWPWRTEGPALLRLWGRWLPLTLPVPVALLVIAALERIGAYGVTESRYGLLLLAVWLAGLAVYGMLARPPRLMAAPASLAVLLLLAAFGPWGAGPVSTRSQLAQLESLLITHGDLPGDATSDAPPVAEVRERIRSVAKYLQADAKQAAYHAWLARQGLTEEGSKPATWAMLTEPEPTREGKWFGLHTGDFDHGGMDVSGYNAILRLPKYNACLEPQTFDTPGGAIGCDVTGSTLKVWRVDRPEQPVILDLSRLNGGERRRGQTPVVSGAAMTLEGKSEGLRVRLYVERIGGRLMKHDAAVINSLQGYLLIGPP